MGDAYRIGTEAFLYTSIALFVTVILVQIPWTLYFITRVLQERKSVSSFRRKRVQSDATGRLILKHKNQLTLQKFFFTATLFELLMTLTIIFDYVLDANRSLISFNCSQYYFVPYLFVKYFFEFIDMVFLQCTIEVLNLTTLFVKDVYLRNNTHSGMKKKINGFIVRFLIVLGLGVSGVGLGIAYIVCEVFIIAQLVLYYRYSRQLYRSLGIHYDDTKYEFGIKSIEARTARKQKKHYKYFTIWLFIIINIMTLGVLGFTIYLPIIILEEECIQTILQSITLQFNSYKLNSSQYYRVHSPAD